MASIRFDLVVVGAGITGASTAYHAARLGKRVLLIEKYQIGHAHGSSHGPSRIIRLGYSDPHHVHLAQLAYGAWSEIEAESGETLMVKTGGLDFSLHATHSLNATRRCLLSEEIPHDWLDAAEIKSRFPQFNLPDSAVGLYQADSAILDADRCVFTLVDLAKRHGALLWEGERVQHIFPTGAGVQIQTDSKTVLADRLVLAAGPWTQELTAPLGLSLPLTITHEQVGYFEPLDPNLFEVGRFPLMIAHHDDAPFNSGFPLYGEPGVKLMIEHKRGGEDVQTAVDLDRLQRLKRYANQLLPGLGRLIRADVCRYTLTPDEGFILDRHPDWPQIVIATPCSGHGFKFGSIIGKLLTQLAFEIETDDLDIGRLLAPFGIARLL